MRYSWNSSHLPYPVAVHEQRRTRRPSLHLILRDGGQLIVVLLRQIA